jgi:hypothetical protein
MPLKPWSTKKRLIVTSCISLLIMGIALVIGTSIYGLGRIVGLFSSQNLYSTVSKEMLKDPVTIAKFYNSLYQNICHNPELGYQFSLYPRFRISPSTTPENICSELTLTSPQGQTSYLKIIGYPKPASTSLNTLVSKLTQVKTSNFNHPLYPATLIEGYQNDMPITSIFIAPNEFSSWNILFYPSNPVDFPLLEKLAKSFKLTDN